MKKKSKTKKELLVEFEDLRARLEEAEETLRAMRSGEVEALAVETPQGDQVLSLKGTDRIYRTERNQAEEDLRRQREWLRVTLSSIGDAVIASDTSSRITFLNPVAVTLTGWQLEETLGQPIRDVFRIIDEKTHEPAEDLVARVLNEKRVVGLANDTALVTKDGREVPIEDSAAPILDASGNVTGVVLVFHDVTEKRRAQAALHAAHDRAVWLARFPEQNPNPIIRASADGTVLYCNPASANLPGWTCEVGQLLQNELLPLVGRAIADEREVQQDVQLDERFYIIWIVPFPEARYANIYGRDITKRQRAEEALRESEQRLNRAQEIAHLGSWELDLVNNRLTWSDEVYRIFGLQPQEFSATYEAFLEAVHPDDRAAVDAAYSGSVREGRDTYEIEHRVVKKSTNEIRIVHERCQHIRNASKRIIRSIGMVHDITERKRTEEELRRSRDELEIKVQERTAELRNINAALQIEIDERERAEKALKEQSKILEGFFTSTITPLVLLDRDFNFIRVNEAYAKACQRDVSEFPGHNHFEFYPHEENKAIFRRVVETKIPFQTFAKPFTFPDHPEWGTTYWNWTLTPILDAKGEVEFLVFSLEDVTERVQTEKERTRLAHIVETTSDLIAMANLDGQLFYLNKAGRKMLGLSEEEDISGVRIADAHPDWANAMVLNEGIPSALQTGFWSGETAFLNRDGTEIPASQVILAHKGLNGEVEFLSTIARDITERRRAAEAAEVERQRFNDVLEMLPAYLVLLTPDYHIPFANRFFRERFGESHGRCCFDYLFGRSEPCETCETYTVLKTLSPHKWEWTGPDGRNYDVFDFPFTDTDGSTLILEMGIDITERKRAEEALKATSLYARGLIEASLDPLITISKDGKIMDVNSATEEVIGLSRNHLIGSDFSDYFTEPKQARKGYKEVFSKGSVRDYPLAIRHTSGRITDVLYNATLYRNEAGEIQGIFAAARDITERKRAEEACRESEGRLRHLSSQLLTVQENERKRISREIHDSLGQSLSAIKFKVEGITNQMRESRHKEIAGSLEILLPIIQASIEESRRIQMDLRPSVLDDLGIIATLSWFSREFQQTYPNIRIEKEMNIQENELSDPLKTVIYRMSQEALNNIAKHSKANLVRLSIGKKGDSIELTIQDNGVGFNLEEILAQEWPKRGLGLTSMRERAELSGGSFAIESTIGKGTTIKAAWPL